MSALRYPPPTIPLDPWDAVQVWPFYTTRLHKNGPDVPARLIVLDGDRDMETDELLSDQELIYEVAGDRHVLHQNPWPERWPWHAIDEAEWLFLAELAHWVRRYDQSHPLANPHRPIAWAQAPVF